MAAKLSVNKSLTGKGKEVVYVRKKDIQSVHNESLEKKIMNKKGKSKENVVKVIL